MSGIFGEQRLVRPEYGAGPRLLQRVLGVADPAHFLHWRYLERALDGWKDLDPKRILDAGCGAGDYSFYLARRYPSAQVLGIDIREDFVERNRDTAQRLGIANARFETHDLANEPFEESFDLMVSIDVLEHVVPQDQAFGNLARALAEGGRAFLHVPVERERPVPFSERLTDFHEWGEEEHLADDLTADEFVAALSQAGFEILESHGTFGYYTGELATSLFTLPFQDTPRNRILQGLLAPPCRLLALADSWGLDKTRYAVAVHATRVAPR